MRIYILSDFLALDDPTFKQLVPETSFLFRASAYIEGIQESSLNNHLQMSVYIFLRFIF